MYAGRHRRAGAGDGLFATPAHPYRRCSPRCRGSKHRARRLTAIPGACPICWRCRRTAAASATAACAPRSRCAKDDPLLHALAPAARGGVPLPAGRRWRVQRAGRSRASRQAARRGAEPRQTLPSPAVAFLGGRREVVHAVEDVALGGARGRDAQRGRRVGLRQVDARPPAAAPPRADVGHGDVRRPAISARCRARAAAAPSARWQIVFRDLYGSLDPRMKVSAIVAGRAQDPRPRARRRQARAEVEKRLLLEVGLRRNADRYPHEFSGGQLAAHRHRAHRSRTALRGLRRAVSALDVSVQAQVINPAGRPAAEARIAYFFVAARPARGRATWSHRIAVIPRARGRDRHHRPPARRPATPYTRALILSAVPDPTEKPRAKRMALAGDVPSPSAPPPGCPFHPRCQWAESAAGSSVRRSRAMRRNAVACHVFSCATRVALGLFTAPRMSHRITRWRRSPTCCRTHPVLQVLRPRDPAGNRRLERDGTPARLRPSFMSVTWRGRHDARSDGRRWCRASSTAPHHAMPH